MLDVATISNKATHPPASISFWTFIQSALGPITYHIVLKFRNTILFFTKTPAGGRRDK
jgi:hypothetical protein